MRSLEDLCDGTWQHTANQTDTWARCPACDSWVATHPIYDDLVPLHYRPYTEAQETEFAGRAYMVIMSEYRQARERGTLLRDPNRYHVTALTMARPRAYIDRA